ncbi:hypothetical protein PI125_g22948 [Phytophthora idaei]|nr:hypothetical protein PI125_g22948 [Phytophthora idaei]
MQCDFGQKCQNAQTEVERKEAELARREAEVVEQNDELSEQSWDSRVGPMTSSYGEPCRRG